MSLVSVSEALELVKTCKYMDNEELVSPMFLNTSSLLPDIIHCFQGIYLTTNSTHQFFYGSRP